MSASIDPGSEKSIPICDPHFHMWDLVNLPNPNLGAAVDENLPVYIAADYQTDIQTLPSALRLVSRVHVETVVGQMEGGHVVDTIGETRWVCDQLRATATECPFGLVVYVHLARDPGETERVLQAHADVAGDRLRGVRMILNHHPDNPSLTWPQVESGQLTRPAFRESLALLASRDLSFDLSCNPHQIPDAVAVLEGLPELRVVVNHLGFLHDGGDAAHERQWREGMRALAALPNVYLKLSMLWFAREGYHQDAAKEAEVRDLVLEAIEIFGCDRCMFASNYPVDKVMGISIAQLYQQFLRWTAERTAAERAALFHGSAVRAYGLA